MTLSLTGVLNESDIWVSEADSIKSENAFDNSVKDFQNYASEMLYEAFVCEEDFLKSLNMEAMMVAGAALALGVVFSSGLSRTLVNVIDAISNIIQKIISMIKNAFGFVTRRFKTRQLKFVRKHQDNMSRKLRVLWEDRKNSYVVFSRPEGARTLKELQNLDAKNLLNAKNFGQIVDELESILKAQRIAKGELREVREFRAKIPQMLKENAFFRQEAGDTPAPQSSGIEIEENVPLSAGPTPDQYIEFMNDLADGYEKRCAEAEGHFNPAFQKFDKLSKEFKRTIEAGDGSENNDISKETAKEIATEIFQTFRVVQLAAVSVGRGIKDGEKARIAWCKNLDHVIAMAEETGE